MNLEKILLRSAALEEELLRFFDHNKVSSSARHQTTYTMCSIAFEHAKSARILMEVGNFTSAIGMTRLQYEALVRAVWVFHAASERLISKLSEELTPESEKAASKMPMLSQMLTEIEKSAPRRAYEMLNEIKSQSWKAMNSYTHSGIHAVSRCKEGYPLVLLINCVKHSNNMSSLAAILYAILTSNNQIAFVLDKVQSEFGDCIQLEKPSQ
ncbi:MAG: hypothetical protein ACI8ZB_003779 [Desulforhopalus sp.]|jgi:hypothetical protein